MLAAVYFAFELKRASFAARRLRRRRCRRGRDCIAHCAVGRFHVFESLAAYQSGARVLFVGAYAVRLVEQFLRVKLSRLVLCLL